MGRSPRRVRGNRVYLTTLRHDFRAPISAIISCSELLIEDLTDAADTGLLDDLAKIRSAGRTLLQLVDELFDPSAIATGELDLPRVGRRLRHDLRTPLNHVIGYAELLAEDAENSDRPALTADLNRIRDAGSRVLAMIDDVLAGTDTAAEAPDGPDPGALSDIAAEVVQDLEAFGAARPTRGADGAGGRILVVDDNELNRDMLARRVRALGHFVEVADSGEAALEAVKRYPFDVILLDIVMPGMNGYEVLRHLKADPGLRSVPVIMISALDEVESAVRCIELGAEDYLPKPFDPTLLRARVGASLEKKRLLDREQLHLQQIDEERRRADELLHVIFPDEVVRELKATRSVRPRRFENVAVLFTDIVGFTRYAEHRDPEEVVSSLQRLVREHEELTVRHGMEKIKTIGDSFMATAGLLRPSENPVLPCVHCGLEMIQVARVLPPHWDLRVGIHVGPLVAGVLGRRQYLYDVIGDTVNTASRVEKHGIPGSVTLSGTAWAHIADQAQGVSLGEVDVKGKGRLELIRFVDFD